MFNSLPAKWSVVFGPFSDLRTLARNARVAKLIFTSNLLGKVRHGRPSKEAVKRSRPWQPFRRCAMALAAAMANSLQNLFPQSLPWMHGKHPWAGLRSGGRSGRAGAPRPGGCMHAMENHGDRRRQRPSRWPQAIAMAIPRHYTTSTTTRL